MNAKMLTSSGVVNAASQSNAFYMPALGMTKRWTRWTVGFGLFAQGGMGTEFGPSSWMADPSGGTNTALTAGLVNRSEVSIGRAIVPVVWEATDWLQVGGSLDFIWAGMDLQMAMSQSQFADMATTQQMGQVIGTMVQSFGQMFEPMGGQGIRKLHHAYFDFSNNSAFTGEAKATGWGGKLRAVIQASEQISFGATYHTRTQIGNLTSDNAVVSMGVEIDMGVAQGQAPMGQYMDAEIPVSGRIEVENFEWPASLGAGVSFQVNRKLMVALDVRRVFWAEVMDKFEMRFTADNSVENGGFANQTLQATLYQDWKDQTILSIGGRYDLSDMFQVRAGFNHAQNPVPDPCLNALFPAIVENHLAMGLGINLSPKSRLDLSVSRAFEKQCTNPGLGQIAPPVISEHSQTNGQVVYSIGF